MPQACVVFVLLCVYLLDLATKEMEKPCPILEGNRLALSNALFKLHPGREGWCQLLALAWNEMSRAETGGVWVSLFPPSGVPWHLLFLYFFFLWTGESLLFWSWFKAQVGFFQSKYTPFLGPQFPVCKEVRGLEPCFLKPPASSEMR